MGERRLKSLREQQKSRQKAEATPKAAETAEVPKPPTVEARIVEAAEPYDYQVEKRGLVFLLRKRYTNPLDLPDVTLGEGAASLKAITKLLSPFNPNVKRQFVGVHVGKLASAEASFMASLTNEQQEQLQTGGLKVSELSPSQKRDVRQIAMFYCIQRPFENAYGTMAQFDRLLKKATALCQQKEDGRLAVGYEDPTGWFGKPWFMPLDQLPIFSTPFPTPTSEAVKSEAVWAVQRKAAGVITLGQMISSLNQRTPSAHKVVVSTCSKIS